MAFTQIDEHPPVSSVGENQIEFDNGKKFKQALTF